MKLSILNLIILLLLSFSVIAQNPVVKGIVTDAKTSETLVGATILVQGTTQGTITDFSGEFYLPNLKTGDYNLVVSFISYNPEIIKVSLKEGSETNLEVKLDPATLDIDEVKVVARRRDDTEISLLSSLKAEKLIVNGISSQQIRKSQDKDAAEVIRRVPGITITDGRFVIVRGLIERYNSIMLNGSTAPSFEADKRAFSFDAIPSGMINNILIYKSPAPELPADFAGAAINIETKDVADENSLVISYGGTFVPNTTFSKSFNSYSGGKYDWLGIDDESRSLPEGVPNPKEFSDLYTWENVESYVSKTKEITNISKLFSNNWEVLSKSPFLDQSISITGQFRFLLGKATIGNITSLNYGISSDQTESNRIEYMQYDSLNDKMIKDFDFHDNRSKQSSKLGLIHNWNILYGKNQKLEFRNFINQMGTTSTNIRNGINYYNVETLKLLDLKFVSRFVYSGQLAGEQNFNSDRTKINWMLGYGFTGNDQPDNRRLTYVLEDSEGSDNYNEYFLRMQNVPNSYLSGRLWLNMKENIYNLKFDLIQDISLLHGSQGLKLKTGLFYELKNREFDSRLIGIVAMKNPTMDFFSPASEIFSEENFYFDETAPYTQHGLSYRDNTRAKDSYNAIDKLTAGYLSIEIPISNFDIYGGVRVENFNRLISDFYEETSTPELYDIKRDTTIFFPSANLTYTINEKNLLRASYGKTVNRPEFREMSNFDYQDFDMFVLIHGNDSLKNSYIQNFDFRYEFYPSNGEIISIGAFYKKFINPIEIFLIPAGTGYDYKPYNTEEANSIGLELDIRKQFVEFEKYSGILHYLKDFTFIFNASLIKSEITTNQSFARDKHRIMQGQSPYIINAGLNYQNNEIGLSANISYNRVGERIAFVGTPNNPNTWEQSRNSLDFNIEKQIGERISFKAGVKDILNGPVKFVQYYGIDENKEMPTLNYLPNRQISVGVVIRL